MAMTNEERILKQLEKRSKLGACGNIYIDDTAQHTGPYVAFTALEETVVDVSDCTLDMEDAADFTVPAGVTIFGMFQVLSLTSGKVIAYKDC